MRSATSADWVADPPGELITSATAWTLSAVNARRRASSTVVMLMTDRGTGPLVAVITPWSRTTLTVRVPVAAARGPGRTEDRAEPNRICMTPRLSTRARPGRAAPSVLAVRLLAGIPRHASDTSQ